MDNKKNRVIYILLTDTGTLFTKMIKWFTNAPYNHVSIVFDEKLEEIYSFGRKRPRNPLIAGFVQENVYTGTYKHFQNTRCLLLKYNVSEKEYENIRQVIQFFNSNKELFSYNLIGLLGVLFSIPIDRKTSFFCSQFVAEVFKRSGIKLWNLPSGLVTPNDFITHHSFEIIYEGYLYDYPLLDERLNPGEVSKQSFFSFSPVAVLKRLLL